ncbi:MAG: NUDIX domain-containing protein [Thermoanaerobaculia bacterium]|nr:NUDIX domain-containing protein [Thermoanaerobaculia bacterium]
MRPTAFCLLENNGRLLLQEFWHEHDHYHFYRPPGGGIEHGELAADAVRREMREELDLEITDPQLLTVLENIFDYGSEIKHEIVFLFRTELSDERFIHTPEVRMLDNSFAFRAVWHSIDELIDGKVVLYPLALQQRLREFFPESLSV